MIAIQVSFASLFFGPGILVLVFWGSIQHQLLLLF